MPESRPSSGGEGSGGECPRRRRQKQRKRQKQKAEGHNETHKVSNFYFLSSVMCSSHSDQRSKGLRTTMAAASLLQRGRTVGPVTAGDRSATGETWSCCTDKTRMSKKMATTRGEKKLAEMLVVMVDVGCSPRGPMSSMQAGRARAWSPPPEKDIA